VRIVRTTYLYILCVFCLEAATGDWGNRTGGGGSGGGGGGWSWAKTFPPATAMKTSNPKNLFIVLYSSHLDRSPSAKTEVSARN